MDTVGRQVCHPSSAAESLQTSICVFVSARLLLSLLLHDEPRVRRRYDSIQKLISRLTVAVQKSSGARSKQRARPLGAMGGIGDHG